MLLGLLLVLVAGRFPGRAATAAPPLAPRAHLAEGRFLFGSLLSDPARAEEEAAAGLRVAHLELGWDRYEPQDGVVDAAYALEIRNRLQAFQAAGLKVVLGLGLQYPPGWLFGYAHSRYVNQQGEVAGPLNLTFNQTLRARAERYLQQVQQDLDLNSFWAVRIGSGGLIESLYPDPWDGRHGNSYWAFDLNAQAGADRPPTIPDPPYFGWRPGQARYLSKPFTTAQAEQWYDWYLGALIDGITWQIRAYTQLGYGGYLQVLMPGYGSRPSEHQVALANRLDGTGDVNGTTARGAVWHKVLDKLTDRQNLVVYVSSVADGSGGNDTCQPGDAFVSLNDRVVNSWSATRWISSLADRYGLPKMGENPGRTDTAEYSPATMRAAARQMQACGFQGLMWAHAANLHERTAVSLEDYAAVIRQYSQ